MVERDEILEEIRRVARELGVTTLSRRQFQRNSTISLKKVERYFLTWNKAIEGAGLIPTPSFVNRKLSENDLLEDLDRVARQLGRFPTENEYSHYGNYSAATYQKRRWGKWSNVKQIYNAWVNGESIALPQEVKLPPAVQETKPLVAETVHQTTNQERALEPVQTRQMAGPRRRSEYGEPIDFRGLRHAPINEQGVVYLFGMISRELGFLVEAIQQGFPDCEAKREIRGQRGRWESVRIEFEFRSSTFKAHGHDPDGCDLIVCWEHDWPNCPAEVLELKGAIQRLCARP
ncbi:MAG: hypothetical protein HY689_00510 [Chloroflexi bacterium]|nr:hypothetical protein [Chloroflexota bacterium]